MERQDLIQQWESAIKNMRKRDEDISGAQERYQETKVCALSPLNGSSLSNITIQGRNFGEAESH
jgi:hypothetical protein